MGTVLSSLSRRFISIYKQLSLLFETLSALNSTYAKALERLKQSPGVPVSNPSISFWQTPPHALSAHQSTPFPDEADVVIIGSGISGVAVARTILDLPTPRGKKTLKVVVLEARGLCSGATGRNGGHAKCNKYAKYTSLKEKCGIGEVRGILTFSAKHIEALINVAEEEDCLEHSEVQNTETADIFFEEEVRDKFTGVLEGYLLDGKQAGGWDNWEYTVLSADDTNQKLGTQNTAGSIIYPALSLSPYNLVTKIWENLLYHYEWSSDSSNGSRANSHRRMLSIQTFTPCTEITQSSSGYKIHTPRGIINAKQVIHTTNSHVSHLLPPFRAKVFPVRGQVLAQTIPPGPYLKPLSSNEKTQWKSYGFLHQVGFDYLTLRPARPPTRPTPTFILGGAFHVAPDEGLSEVGIVCDNINEARLDVHGALYLRGLLPYVFQTVKSSTGHESSEITNELAVTHSHWTGIMGYSADGHPWVGNLTATGTSPRKGLVKEGGPAEWISAGFSGEGMVNAWGCGVYLGSAVHKHIYMQGPGDEEAAETAETLENRRDLETVRDEVKMWRDLFPTRFLVSKERLERADIRDRDVSVD